MVVCCLLCCVCFVLLFGLWVLLYACLLVWCLSLVGVLVAALCFLVDYVGVVFDFCLLFNLLHFGLWVYC